MIIQKNHLNHCTSNIRSVIYASYKSRKGKHPRYESEISKRDTQMLEVNNKTKRTARYIESKTYDRMLSKTQKKSFSETFHPQ